MESLKLTKINWLIHLRRIYDHSSTQYIQIDLIADLIHKSLLQVFPSLTSHD